MDFLQDNAFLQQINQYRAKEYWAAITCRDFVSEKVITTIQAKVTAGNISIQASSPTRRTGSLTLVFAPDTMNIIEPNNLIAINKKIGLSIGISNPFWGRTDGIYQSYSDYGDILWFKQGVFIITQASSAVSTSGASISVQLIDKMGQLNGTSGGTLPATVSFHDRIIIDGNDDITTERPLIAQIIREAVHHWGGELYDNIVINDVPDVGRRVTIYVGDTPINFTNGPASSFKFSSDKQASFPNQYKKNEVVGYMETELTYPGELVQKGGSNVQQLLDTIAKMLGNFEYFYDVEGVFHFQQIRNYDKTGFTPLIIPQNKDEIASNGVRNEDQFNSMYVPKFYDDRFMTEFSNSSLVTSANFNPQYQNIKNDFICWGTRKDDVSGVEKMVRYHLAIDERPRETVDSLCNKNIMAVRTAGKDKASSPIIRYQIYTSLITYSTTTNSFTFQDINNPIASGLNTGEKWDSEIFSPRLSMMPFDITFDWREELYRQALVNYGSSTQGSYYDEELIAEWRQIYDASNVSGNKSFRALWEGTFQTGVKWNGYHPNVILAPQKLRYWLDLIDTSSPVGAYSVNKIGRRSLVTENAKINEVYPAQVPDVVFFEIPKTNAELASKIQYYIGIGQNYCQLKTDQMPLFSYINSFGTCYEDVRQSMYEHLMYNASVSLTTIPMFYLDVNKIIRLNLPEQGIVGDYIINQMGWQLGNIPTMNISANEALVIV